MKIRLKVESILFFIYFLMFFNIYANKMPKILYINSYSLRYSIAMSEVEGIKKVFSDSNSHLSFEFMNSKEYPVGEIQEQIQQVFINKLKKEFNYDAVLISDDNALHFVEKNYDEFFSDVPVVFFGINDREFASRVVKKNNIKGLLQEVSIYENINLIKKLFPNKQYAIITDGTPEGIAELEKVVKYAREDTPILINLKDLTWSEFGQRMSEIGDIPTLLISSFRDRNNETMFASESMEIIRKNYDGAIFAISEDAFETGEIFGGKVVSLSEHGEEAAKLLLVELGGLQNRNIGAVLGSNRYIFDYDNILKYKIPLTNIPEGSIILNKPETFWSKYKIYISILIFFTSIGYIMIVILLIHIRAKNLMKKKLEVSQSELKRRTEELRKIIDIIPSHIYIKDIESRFLLVNKTCANFFELEPNKMEGLKHTSLHKNKEELEEFLAEDRKILSGEVEEIIQYDDVVTVGGQSKYFHTIKIPYTMRSGQRGVLGVSTEVTERTLMQEELEKKNLELIERNKDIINTQRDVIERLGNIIEHRSQETANHVRRVSKMARLLAERLGLKDEEAELIEIAVPMHDVGKIAISEDILHKHGRLTAEEYTEVKKHAKIGFELLQGSSTEILKTAALIAHEHHERWDGSGYPEGKKGEEIHLYGRITSIADVFDALVTERSYKKAWAVDDAFLYIEAESGKMFDPQLVALFLDNREEIEEIKVKYDK